MKTSLAITSGFALVAAALLAACGGSSTSTGSGGSATVGGSVSGAPTGTTVLLVDKNADIINVNGSGNFAFDGKIQAGEQYNVTLFTQPSGLECSIANAQGTVDQNADAVTNVAVSCQNAAVGLPMYNVGAVVSGLATGNSMTLLLLGGTPLTVNANGLAVFPQALSPDMGSPPSGSLMTIGTQPTGQSCTATVIPTTLAAASVTSTNFVEFSVTCQ